MKYLERVLVHTEGIFKVYHILINLYLSIIKLFQKAKLDFQDLKSRPLIKLREILITVLIYLVV